MLTALLLAAAAAAPQALSTSGPLDLAALLAEHPAQFDAILEHADALRLQLVVAEVVEREDGSLALARSTLGDTERYFYPASAIKTAAAVAAMEWLNELNAERGTAFGLDTELAFAPLFAGEALEADDPSNLAGGRITVGHELRKLSIVSDNRAFNRLYGLVGQDRLDAALARAGFPSFHLVHRLSEARSAADNRRVPAVSLHDPIHDATLALPARTAAPLPAPPDHPSLRIGERWVDGDAVHAEPMDFRGKNRVDLVELQDFLVELVRPEVDTGRRGFPSLTVEQRAFLLEAMGALPRESTNPAYDAEAYPDDWVKFLLPGLRRVLPAERLRVWNKVGLAYGFTVENAYVEDRATGRGFFVTGALYTNANGTLNDGVYEYDAVAFPYWAALGEVLGRHFLAPTPAEADAPR